MSVNGEAGRGLLRQARRLVVLVVGSTVLAVGVAMLVLPGPAVVVIPAGIAILATEFAWARRLLREVKARIGLGDGAGPEHPTDGPRPAEHPTDGSRTAEHPTDGPRSP